MFFNRVCECNTCHEVIMGDLQKFAQFGDSVSKIRSDGAAIEYATTAAKAIAVTHYIFNKGNEFDFVENNSLDNVILDLQNSYDECPELFDVNESAHPWAWIDALSPSAACSLLSKIRMMTPLSAGVRPAYALSRRLNEGLCSGQCMVPHQEHAVSA